MKLSPESKVLNLVDLNVSLKDLLNLIELQEEIGSIARHDLGSSASAIRAELQILQNWIHDKAGSVDILTQERSGNLEYLSDYINRTQQLSERLLSEMNILFPRSPNKTQVLITKPYNIVQGACSRWEGVNITLENKISKTLEIVYPENIFGIIVNELVANSVKHYSSSNCAIAMAWHIHEFKFHFEIHDNGNGIIPNLHETDIVTAGEMLEALRYDKVKPNGITIINKLVLRSGGNLFFSKSKRLGGTLVFFNFPILAYYQEGQIYESK